jgi:hypothetical protein
MPWMLITCGHCAHTADINAFCSTPVSGQLPKDIYQCPACNCAIQRRMAPATLHPSGWVEPGKINLEPIAARL